MSNEYSLGGMSKYMPGLRMGGQNSSQGFNNNNDVAAEGFNYQAPAFNYSPTAGSYDPMSGYGSAPITPTFAGGAAPGGMFDSFNKFMESDTGKNIFGGRDANGKTIGGVAMPALGLAQGLFSGYMGMKAYGMAQKSFKQGQDQFALNYGAQRDTTNARMEDKAAAQYAASGGRSESPESYMKRNGLKAA